MFEGDCDDDGCPDPFVGVDLTPLVVAVEAPPVEPDGEADPAKFVWLDISAGDARLDTGGPGKM